MGEPTDNRVEIAPGLHLPDRALQFTFARGGGPGGQNVNKTSTAATLSVALEDLAEVLPEDALTRLVNQAGHRLAGDRLIIRAADSRSQYANRKTCLLKLRQMVVVALHRPKRRRPRRLSKAAIQRRLDTKRARGQRKAERRANRNNSQM